jgi:PIN domain nuclease of toxin-antitoxin system
VKLLLDTHAFLWLVSSLPKVSPTALDACENVDNEIY